MQHNMNYHSLASIGFIIFGLIIMGLAAYKVNNDKDN